MYAAQNADFSVPVFGSHVLCEQLVSEMVVRPVFCSLVAASVWLVMLQN